MFFCFILDPHWNPFVHDGWVYMPLKSSLFQIYLLQNVVSTWDVGGFWWMWAWHVTHFEGIIFSPSGIESPLHKAQACMLGKRGWPSSSSSEMYSPSNELYLTIVYHQGYLILHNDDARTATLSRRCWPLVYLWSTNYVHLASWDGEGWGDTGWWTYKGGGTPHQRTKPTGLSHS